MIKRIGAFFRRWGLWIFGGLLVIFLLLRRGLVLRQLSRLRAKLAAKQQELVEAETQAELNKHTAAIEQHQQRAAEVRREVASLEAEVDAADAEHQTVLESIDSAKDWAELDKLRREGNARVNP